MTIEQETGLRVWVVKNHPDLIPEILETLAANPRYDYADAVDLADPKAYDDWCNEDD